MVRRFLISLAAAALFVPLLGTGVGFAATGAPIALSISAPVPQISKGGSLRPPALAPPRPLAYPQGMSGAVPLSPGGQQDGRSDLKPGSLSR